MDHVPSFNVNKKPPLLLLPASYNLASHANNSHPLPFLIHPYPQPSLPHHQPPTTAPSLPAFPFPHPHPHPYHVL